MVGNACCCCTVAFASSSSANEGSNICSSFLRGPFVQSVGDDAATSDGVTSKDGSVISASFPDRVFLMLISQNRRSVVERHRRDDGTVGAKLCHSMASPCTSQVASQS